MFSAGLPPPPSITMDWPSATQMTQTAAMGSIIQQRISPSVPTFFDRLESYRQLSTHDGSDNSGVGLLPTLAINTIVSQNPVVSVVGTASGGYTTSLVERTQDLRNWLRQAKHDHELLRKGHETTI